METQEDVQEVLETPETDLEAEETTTNEESESTSEGSDESSEDIETIKREKEALEKKNKQLFERLKKKESEKKDADLSTTDILALAKADVHEDDMERVLKWAKFNGVTVKEALADDDLKVVLERRSEERKTALATHTKGGSRGVAKETPEAVIAKALKGDLPQTDEAIQKLVEAEHARKFRK